MTEEQWKLSILLILTHIGAALAGYVAALGILKAVFDSFVNIFANEEDVTDKHIKGLKILMQIASEKLADSEFKPRQVSKQYGRYVSLHITAVTCWFIFDFYQ